MDGPQRYAGGMEHPTTEILAVPTPYRVLGVDPGLQVTGYAVVEARAGGPRVLEAGVVRSAESRAITDLAPRLRSLYDGLVEVLDQYRPASWPSSNSSPITIILARRS